MRAKTQPLNFYAPMLGDGIEGLESLAPNSVSLVLSEDLPIVRVSLVTVEVLAHREPPALPARRREANKPQAE